MPVPSAIGDLSQLAGTNSPSGGESPTSADDYLRTLSSFVAMLRDGKGHTAEADVASAATCDIGAANSQFVRVTGTTTITSLGTTYNGPRFIRFSGSLTLTHSATLVLPGAVSISTTAGDACIAVPIGSPATGWQVVSYQISTASPSAVATGSIAHFPATNAPSGYLKLNGQLVSRTTYAALWAFAQASGNLAASDGAWTIGQFSPGDGATTFRVPKANGYHIRSWDDGAGVDTGRAIGSTQADAMPSHGHTATVTDPGHEHTGGESTTQNLIGGASGAFVRTNVQPGNNTGAATTGVTVAIGNTGTGTETRVKTIAWLACIKY